MKFKDRMKIRTALLKHQKGHKDEALKLYDELYADGIVQAGYMLPYSVLLMRSGREGAFETVREIMVKAQKAADLTPDRRQQLLMNYAIACWKTGNLEKAVSTLEASHKRQPNTLTYESLGFLYIEAGDAEKALSYNLEALEYDDEDAVTLDNLGQTYYRLLGDKEQAKPYFEKAIALRPRQIDTLYFLAQYDLEEGRPEAAKEKLGTALEGSFSPLNYADRPMVEQLLAKAEKAPDSSTERD